MFGIVACSSPEEVKQSHYETGIELLAENDLIKASIEFRNALQIDDNFVPAWWGMALVEEGNEEWGKVVALLTKVVDLEPTHVEAQIKLGTMMMLIGQLDRAVEVSETALLLDNQNAEVLALRAAVLLKLEDTEGAIDFANRALEIETGNLNAIQILAAERFTQGDYEGALRFITQSGEEVSQNKDLMLIKVLIYETQGNFDLAEQTFRELLENHPDDNEIRLAFVNFYVKYENIDAAEQELRALAALDPTNYETSIDIVRFLNTYQDEEAAEAELIALIQRGTDVVRYQLALSEFYLGNNKTDEAKDVLDKIVERTGSSEDGLIARARLGELALAEGDHDEASQIISEILEIDSVNVAALEMRGSIYLNNNMYDNAIQDLRIVLNETPNSVRASILLSRAYELTGSIELADDTLSDAVRFSDSDGSVALAYANFLIKQSAQARAEEVLVQALNVNSNDLELLNLLARVRLLQQNWLGAQQVADVIKQLDENGNIGSEIEGLALSGQQNYEQSIQSFRNAYSSSGGSNRPLAALIGAYNRAGQRDEAVKFLETILTEDADNYQALILLGQLHMANQEGELAVSAFEKAIVAQPARDAAYMNLISYYYSQGKMDIAMQRTNAALSVIEDNFGLQLMKASILEKDGDFEGAIAVYEQMYAENSGNDVVVNNLASIMSEYRTDNDSINRALELAVRFRQSSVPHFKDTLGWIYYKVGDITAATSILQDVVEQMPQMAIFRYHLGMSYLADDRIEAAIREFEEVVKLSESAPFENLEEVKGLLARLNSAS
tara:strand:- start:282979 stop:285336 length:2358 start_codon:yes stop_codon:yes gene_type:complete